MEALKGKNMGGRALNIGKWLKRLTILQSGASSQRTSMPLKAHVHSKSKWFKIIIRLTASLTEDAMFATRRATSPEIAAEIATGIE